ncbi:MAG TPA: hypothetical protein VHP11_04155 [Tepidisphaeraceae bacterium]|nr:hypothetical protein [Tepidisphaeraceae bacterium]
MFFVNTQETTDATILRHISSTSGHVLGSVLNNRPAGAYIFSTYRRFIMVMRGFWAALVAASFVWSCPSLVLSQVDSPLREARKRVNEAQGELKKAKAELDKAVAKLRVEFRKGDEWVKAQADQKQAQQEFEARRKAVLETLKAKPEYQKALAEKTKTEALRNQLREQEAPADKMVEALNNAMAASAAVTKLETDAVDADSKAAEAKLRVAETTDVLEALNKQFNESVKTNPDLEDVRTAVKTAEDKVTEATNSLKETAKAQRTR